MVKHGVEIDDVNKNNMMFSYILYLFIKLIYLKIRF